MRKTLFICFFILSCYTSFAQIIAPDYKSVVFSYDEAGNQISRIAHSLEISSNSSGNKTTMYVSDSTSEDLFFEYIQLFPVPVQNDLTIKWDNNVDGEIFSIGIYNHSQLNFFYKENVQSLSGHLEINMSTYNPGIYIIQFTLNDGRVYAKSIIKK
ncbi:T9SS type A sorting domain-containing protein [Empedobacter brevis]|uniref:T9SS type A sorting domain-containing protein n=1 Tax=Empedobacter brevis TaxID=247 RepID=UPI0028A1752B|nr:T9SS type A sorting domain-containing protein [Empedobacter brevis]